MFLQEKYDVYPPKIDMEKLHIKANDPILKLLCTIGLFLLCGGCCSASKTIKENIQDTTMNMTHTEVIPHLQQAIQPGQNLLWCSTLQLAWNELYDLAGGPITMEEEAPLVALLNQRTATKSEIDPESYAALAGIVGQLDLTELETQAKHFDAQAVIAELQSLPAGSLTAYSYLFKQLPFEWAFTRFKTPLLFGEAQVAAFGVQQYMPGRDEDDRIAQQVSILDYQGDSDFIVQLQTQSAQDRLILAKVKPAPTLEATLHAVLKRVQTAAPEALQKLESLTIPVIDFDRQKAYPELCNRKITSGSAEVKGRQFSLVTQRIRFKLDETGAQLESKTRFLAAKPPRRLTFDAPFLVVLVRQEADTPYFALWVDNAEILTPFAP